MHLVFNFIQKIANSDGGLSKVVIYLLGPGIGQYNHFRKASKYLLDSFRFYLPNEIKTSDLEGNPIK